MGFKPTFDFSTYLLNHNFFRPSHQIPILDNESIKKCIVEIFAAVAHKGKLQGRTGFIPQFEEELKEMRILSYVQRGKSYQIIHPVL